MSNEKITVLEYGGEMWVRVDAVHPLRDQITALESKLDSCNQACREGLAMMAKQDAAMVELRSRLDALQKEHDALIHDHERVMERETKLVNEALNDEDKLHNALAEVHRLDCHLGDALKFVSYIAKRYEEGWDEPITERFYNEARQLLGVVERRGQMCENDLGYCPDDPAERCGVCPNRPVSE